MKLAEFLFKKTEYFFSLDIGTETVKGLIFSVTKEGKSKRITILGNAVRYLDFTELFKNYNSVSSTISSGFLQTGNNGSFFEAIKKATAKVIEEAYQNLEFHCKNKGLSREAKEGIHSMIVGLPANILKGRIYFYSFERKKPGTVIEEKEEEQIYENVTSRAKEKIAQFFSGVLGILPREIRFINLKIVEIKIDGYEVPTLFGYKGKKLTFKILATILSEYDFREIEGILGKRTNGTSENGDSVASKIVYPAESLALLVKNSRINGIFIDVGGSWTQLFVIDKGKINHIAELESGGKTFSQSISKHLGMNISDARVLKERYSQKLLSEEARGKIHEIVTPDVENWFRVLKRKLRERPFFLPNGWSNDKEKDYRVYYRGYSFPSDIFLFGGGSQLPEIQEILEEGEWESILLSSPRVKMLYPGDVSFWWMSAGNKKSTDITKSINNPKDITSILLCYYEQ